MGGGGEISGWGLLYHHRLSPWLIAMDYDHIWYHFQLAKNMKCSLIITINSRNRIIVMIVIITFFNTHIYIYIYIIFIKPPPNNPKVQASYPKVCDLIFFTNLDLPRWGDMQRSWLNRAVAGRCWIISGIHGITICSSPPESAIERGICPCKSCKGTHHPESRMFFLNLFCTEG